VIDEIVFIVRGPSPFLRLPRAQQRFDIVEPKFYHPVEVSSPIAGDFEPLTLDETLDPGNCSADRPMNIAPVSVKLFGR
jgi:hypothetical protein